MTIVLRGEGDSPRIMLRGTGDTERIVLRSATTITTGGGIGTGDVVGPASATDSAVALFDTTSGELLKDGGTLGTAAFAATGDFATAAQGGLADTATQPGDLAAVATSGAYGDLSGTPTLGTAAGVDTDTDGTLAANSDTLIPTQKAVKTYADQLIAAADVMVFKGVIDCSANPNYPAADAGWTRRVSVAGKIGGASGVNVEVGDLLLCLVDGTVSGDQATVGSSWSIAQTNIDGAVIGPAGTTDGYAVVFDGPGGHLVKAGSGPLGTAAYTAASAYDAAGAAASAQSAASSDATSKANAAQAYAIQRANHTGTQLLATISDVGTAAAKNIPATGDAASTEAVLGSDSRLTNARTPSAHKSSHATGGIDALAPSDIGAVAAVQAVNAQIGTTYTFVAADAGKLVTLSNASAITLTLPQDSDATIAVGAYVDLYQLGAGQVTVTAGSGATLRTSGLTAKARAQYARFGVQKVSANTWSLYGDLAAS